MNSIDASALNGRPRPRARILQWGEGNFLRAFVDWKIDRMNEAGGLDWGVVIVRPIAEGNPHWLNEQDGLYTVLSRGVADDDHDVVVQPLAEPHRSLPRKQKDLLSGTSPADAVNVWITGRACQCNNYPVSGKHRWSLG